MRTFTRLPVALFALLLLVPATAEARRASSHRPACYKLTPSVLQFSRQVGQPRGLLSWRQPRKKVRVGRRGRRPSYTYKQYPAFAFRVYRDGAVVGQTRKTWMQVAVRAGQSYQFRVRAVNGHGRQSGCKGALLRRTVPLLGPGQPANVAASGTSPTSLSLSWRPGPAGDGTLAGYRVFRDGVSLGQVRGTAMQVSNLYSNRDYTFTVQAVDTAGRLSPPSLPLYTSTQPPVQTTGRVQAFLLATTDASFRDLQAHYMDIGTIFPTYFDCNPTTGLTEGQDDPLVTTWAKRRGIQVLPRYNCQFPTVEHKIFTDPATRSAALGSVVNLVQQYGYDGINIDFEAAPASDRDLFSQFVADLSARLHAIGRRVTVDVSPKTLDNDPNHPRGNTFDYAALNQYADNLFLMMWGAHWSSSWPGPLMDLTLTNQVLTYADQAVPDRSKWVLGAAMYGLDWPAGGGIDHQGTPREYGQLMSIASQYGATPQWDPAAGEMTFKYTDSGGVPHEVWYETAPSIAQQMAVAKAHGFGGLGVWHLGTEDQTIWSLPVMQPGGFAT
jgi:spore germination protein YaaH